VDPGHTGEQFRFDPAKLSVPTGSAILVANVGGKPHTLTADNGAFDTGVIAPGPGAGQFAGRNTTFTVDKPGIFAFHCEIHPKQMKGVLTVTGKEVTGLAASAGPKQAKVSIQDFSFSPVQLAVAPGAKVLFANGGQQAHTATFDEAYEKKTLDTNVIQPGSQGSFTAPDKPGTYAYKCSIHPKRMNGVLVVLGPGVIDPTRLQAAPPSVLVPRQPPSGGLSIFVLSTAVLGALLGGFGLGAFSPRRRVGRDIS
jgi:plastocyanin